MLLDESKPGVYSLSTVSSLYLFSDQRKVSLLMKKGKAGCKNMTNTTD